MHKTLQQLQHSNIDPSFFKEVKEIMDINFALDQASIVAITDNKGKITYANQKFCEISKYTLDELIGQDHRILNSGYHSKNFFKNMWKTIGKGEKWTGEVRNKAKDGSYYWVHTTIVPFLNEKGKAYQYISIRQDITSMKRLEQQMRFNAFHDELTRLPNRHHFQEDLNDWLSEKNNTKSLAIMFVDIDRFKNITDTIGHTNGDYVLKAVAKRLSRDFKGIGDVYRFGGDEFTIVLKNHSLDEVKEMVRKVKALFYKPFTLHKKLYYLSVSIGVALSPKDGTDLETLVKKADIAINYAKMKGSNSVQFFNKETHEELSKNMKIETELRLAIKRDEFVLHYQPLVHLKHQKMVGVEALIRWNHPENGLVPPSEFIPLAEETGLIIPISEWVLKTVCNQLNQWHEKGLLEIYAAVNISPIFFESAEFIRTVKRILLETQVDPTFLEFEITESLMQDPENVIPLFAELKALGISLSIDDFGTGYSSLSSLSRFPIDILKIDRSFIEDISKDGGIMVKTILTMASNLGLKVIAEGIETKDQLNFLNAHTCSLGQGYLFSRPIAPSMVPVTVDWHQEGNTEMLSNHGIQKDSVKKG